MSHGKSITGHFKKKICQIECEKPQILDIWGHENYSELNPYLVVFQIVIMIEFYSTKKALDNQELFRSYPNGNHVEP
jgi:hypothetical protein